MVWDDVGWDGKEKYVDGRDGRYKLGREMGWKRDGSGMVRDGGGMDGMDGMEFFLKI